MATAEEKFDQAFRVADEAREEVLAILEKMSQDDFERRPASDEWSIGEIAHHLLLVERRYCDLILKVISTGQEGEFSEQEVEAERPFPLEDTVDITKVGKGKAPEPVQPAQGLEVEAVVEQLRKVRVGTRSRLSPYRSRDLGNLWHQHPRFGPVTLYEQIRLMGYHELKHLAQMTRAREATTRPQ